MTRQSIASLWAVSALALSLAACSGEQQTPAETAEAPASTSAAPDIVETDPTPTSEAVAETVAETVTETVAPAAETTTETEPAAGAATPTPTAPPAAAAGVIPDEAKAQYAALTGDATAGERVFRQCMACHVVQAGVNRVGPSLHGIVGRKSGSVEGFKYSPANANSGVTWTEEAMFVYLASPKDFIPGTIMAFAGVKDAQQRADLIAYLKTQSN